MQIYSRIVTDHRGNIINTATVTIYESDGITVATIYDRDGAPLSNPISSGHIQSRGDFEFSAQDGEYIVDIDYVGYTANYNIRLYEADIYVDTMADLRALTVEDGKTVWRRGYYTAGDHEPLAFIGKTGGSYTDNGGTIAVSGGGSGADAWEADPDVVTPDIFGAKADGVTDDHAAIVSSIRYCESTGNSLYIPAGVYVNGTQIRIYKGISIYGDGAGEESNAANRQIGKTRIICNAVAGMFLLEANTETWIHGASIKDLWIDGNNISSIAIHGKTVGSCVFENIGVLRCTGDGILIDDGGGNISQYNEIRNYYYNATGNAASANSHGIRFNSTGAGLGGVVQTVMENITTITADGSGVVMNCCDNNLLYKHQGTVTGTGYSLYFGGNAFLTSRNNVVFYFTGSVHAESPTYGNRILHSTSESMSVTMAAGAQLHYDVIDYVTSGVFESQRYLLSDKKWLGANELQPDGAVATRVVHASQWGAIQLPDASTGTCFFNIPQPAEWNEGNITTIEIVFSTDTANSSADIRLNVRLSSLATTQGTASPTINELFTVPVNDLLRRVNKATLDITNAVFSLNDIVLCRVSRLGADAADTALGNIHLLGVNINYESLGPTSAGSGPFTVSPIGT